MLKRMVAMSILVLMALVLVACGSTVSQEEYDQVVADLDQAEAEIERLENELSQSQGEVESLQSELDAARGEAAGVQGELDDLLIQVEDAQMAAGMLDSMLQVALGGEIAQEDAMGLFMELSEQVEASGDEELQAKFQAVLTSLGGEQEAIELVQYLLQMVSQVGGE